MPEVTKHEPGSFCWVELSTSDTKAAAGFYGTVFGWTADSQPQQEGGDYTTFELDGKAIGGGYVQTDQERSQAIPPHWNLYVSTDDVDKTVAKATELGGNAIVPGMDLPMGRMGVIADPTGAMISVWQSEEMPGFALRGDPGTFVWAELGTQNKDAATPFYTELFGWTAQEQGEEFGNYTIFARPGNEQGDAGMMTAPDPNMPSAWLAYFGVDDADAIAQAVTDNGGKVEMPPMDIPTIGRFAILSDPQGAVFAVIKGMMPEEG